MTTGNITEAQVPQQPSCYSKISMGTKIIVALAAISSLSVCVYFVLKKQGLLPSINQFLQGSVGQIGQFNLKVWHVISSGTGALVLFGGTNALTHYCTKKRIQEKVASQSRLGGANVPSDGGNVVEPIRSFTVEGTLTQLGDLKSQITKAKAEELSLKAGLDARVGVWNVVSRIVPKLESILQHIEELAVPAVAEGALQEAPLAIPTPIDYNGVVVEIFRLFQRCESLVTPYAQSICAPGTLFANLKADCLNFFYDQDNLKDINTLDIEGLRGLFDQANSIQEKLVREMELQEALQVGAQARLNPLMEQFRQIEDEVQRMKVLDVNAFQRGQELHAIHNHIHQYAVHQNTNQNFIYQNLGQLQAQMQLVMLNVLKINKTLNGDENGHPLQQPQELNLQLPNDNNGGGVGEQGEN